MVAPIEKPNKDRFIGFCMPFVMVKHSVSGKEGTLMFQHMPRFYFAFTEG